MDMEKSRRGIRFEKEKKVEPEMPDNDDAEIQILSEGHRSFINFMKWF